MGNYNYLTISGEIKTYHYKRSDMKKRPQCVNCGGKVIKIMTGSRNHETVGYKCRLCNFLFITMPFEKVFRGELK